MIETSKYLWVGSFKWTPNIPIANIKVFGDVGDIYRVVSVGSNAFYIEEYQLILIIFTVSNADVVNSMIKMIKTIIEHIPPEDVE